MKYYTIAFPGECGQHVQETWSEEQILKSAWYRNWVLKMVQADKAPLMTEQNALDDWIVVHWAVETDQFGNKVNDQYTDIISDGGMDPRDAWDRWKSNKDIL